MKIKITCKQCHKNFKTYRCRKGIRKFCSRDCYWKAKRGKQATKKQLRNLKKGHGWNKGKVTSNSYWAVHKWINRNYGTADVCSVCASNGGKTGCEWANLDHTYKRKIEDWIKLCSSCHKLWDNGSLPINLFEWQERIQAGLDFS